MFSMKTSRKTLSGGHGVPNTAPPELNSPYRKSEVDWNYSKEEGRLNNALEAAMAMSRPMAVPPQVLFPPRYGLEHMDAPTIEAVLSTDRQAGRDRRLDYSGVDTRYSATTRPSIGSV